MNAVYNNLSDTQRSLAIQRLTALWAFAESGLGGVMHALQVPFTGLLVGGFAVIIITLIAKFSEKKNKQILKSFLIVLLVKAMVSPYTPFPAYIALSFQAILGYLLFRFLQVNFISILLLSVFAMMESAIQKLLVLTFFFGQSLWKAADGLADFITGQFGLHQIEGSYWIIVLYLFIYLVGGIAIARLAYKTTRTISLTLPLPEINTIAIVDKSKKAKKHQRKIWNGILLLFIISVLLFFYSPEKKSGWIAVLKTVSWTLSAITIWYVIITPLFRNFILWLLKKKETKYSRDVSDTLSLIPSIKALSISAWHQSRRSKGIKRIPLFLSLLLQWSLTYSETTVINQTT